MIGVVRVRDKAHRIKQRGSNHKRGDSLRRINSLRWNTCATRAIRRSCKRPASAFRLHSEGSPSASCMLSLHAASRPDQTKSGKRKPAPRTPTPTSARIGLAIAGGGPIGAMYELGALRALDEALDGIDLTRMDCYVGVSSGAFLAAGLVNRMSTTEMCRIFITGESDDVRFRPETFLRPAVFEYMRRASALPRLTLEWWGSLLNPRESRLSDLILRFGGLVPAGLFDNTEVERFLREIFSRGGRSNDLRELDRELYVVAVDLDSGEAVRLGGEHWMDMPM